MSELESLWQEVTRTALLGAERQAVPAVREEGKLGRLLGALEGRGGEERLLATAAVLSAYCRAGRAAERVDFNERPLEEQGEATAGPGATRQLRTLLEEGGRRALLPEWVRLARGARVVVAPEVLPEVLEAGKRERDLRALLRPVLGRRGLWLARQNERWAWALPRENLEELWETGSREEREEAFRRLRQQDPGGARLRLEALWKELPAAERAHFLGLLREGLSVVDEAFLEGALADRSQEVRRGAVDLLTRLPGSVWQREMEERLRGRVRLVRGKRGRSEVEVQLPSPEEAGRGLEGGVGRGQGEGAALLERMIAAVPPRFWLQETPGSGVEEWLQAAERSDFALELRRGWAVAAERSGDETWAEALLRSPGRRPWEMERVAGLAALLPEERWEALAREMLAGERERGGRGVRGASPLLALLRAGERGWSPGFTRDFLESLEPARAMEDWVLREALSTLALRMDTETALEWVRKNPVDEPPPWVELLSFRGALSL